MGRATVPRHHSAGRGRLPGDLFLPLRAVQHFLRRPDPGLESVRRLGALHLRGRMDQSAGLLLPSALPLSPGAALQGVRSLAGRRLPFSGAFGTRQSPARLPRRDRDVQRARRPLGRRRRGPVRAVRILRDEGARHDARPDPQSSRPGPPAGGREGGPHGKAGCEPLARGRPGDRDGGRVPSGHDPARPSLRRSPGAPSRPGGNGSSRRDVSRHATRAGAQSVRRLRPPAALWPGRSDFLPGKPSERHGPLHRAAGAPPGPRALFFQRVSAPPPPLVLFVRSRYRLPLARALLIYGASFVDRLRAEAREAGTRYPRLAQAAAAALGLALLSFFPLGRPSIPAEANVYYNIGNLLAARGRHPEAIASLDRSLAQWPGSAYALINRGNSLDKLGREDEALASYMRAEEASPGFWQADKAQGVVLHRNKRYEEEEVVYRRGLKTDGEEAYYLLGVALKNLNRQDEAGPAPREGAAPKPPFRPAATSPGRAGLRAS